MDAKVAVAAAMVAGSMVEPLHGTPHGSYRRLVLDHCLCHWTNDQTDQRAIDCCCGHLFTHTND